VREKGKGTAGADSPYVERELGRLAEAPVPPGLRQRTLACAAQARRGAALTPAWRLAAAFCLALIGAVLLADPLAGRHEAARLQALLDGRQDAEPSIRAEQELAEILGVPGLTAERLTRLRTRAAAAARLERESRLADARRRLKGWLDNEASEDLI